MKIYVFFCVMMLFVSSCASQKQTVQEGVRDGLTIERAIKAKSVDFEYQWVEQHYPGSRVTGQVLLTKNRIPYDKLEVVSAEGKKIELYFDISSFFGKW